MTEAAVLFIGLAITLNVRGSKRCPNEGLQIIFDYFGFFSMNTNLITALTEHKPELWVQTLTRIAINSRGNVVGATENRTCDFTFRK